VYLVHGSYYFRPKDAKPVNLGKDLAAALAKYGTLIAGSWGGRSLGDVIDRYRTEILPLKRSPVTRADQAKQLDRLKIAFGMMLPDNITMQQCYAYEDGRRSGKGERVPVIAHHEISLLGHVFAKAIKWGKANGNPVRGMSHDRSPKRAHVPLDRVAAVRALANERMRLAIDLAVSLGQRRGDLLKIKWQDVTDEGVLIEQSKTGARVLIERSADLNAILDRLRALKPDIPRDYLLRKRNGRPYSEDGFSTIWQRLQRKYAKTGGVRFSFHDLRSVSADGAATAEEARDRLGHADVATTKRHYLRGVTRAKPRS
jgi:hypothetical protein